MKKSIQLLNILLLFSIVAKSQITKGNWMIGGNASFSFSGSDYGTYNTRVNGISLSPNVGYFFIDKLAGGLRLGYYRNNSKFKNVPGLPSVNFNKTTVYTFGPYIRYYFLPEEKSYNILAEGSYQFGTTKTETEVSSNPAISTNNFSIAAGPVIYFNSSVGIEFLLNYSTTNTNNSITKSYKLGIGIGLQIHLQKDKP